MIDLTKLSQPQLTALMTLAVPTNVLGWNKSDMIESLERYTEPSVLMAALDAVCNGMEYYNKKRAEGKGEQAQLPAPPVPSPVPAASGGLDGIVAGMVHAEVERIKGEGAFTSKTIVLTKYDHETKKKEMENEVLPEEFEQIMQLVSLRKNVMLVGPTGCGKTHVAEAVARMREETSDFGSISVTYGMSKSDLLGQLLPVGESGRFEYLPSVFVNMYENGGTFLCDEADNGDPNTFGILNQALSNNQFWLPMRPENPHVKRHPDFVMIAAANTYGTGADMQYVGRAQLDRATLDRFKSGIVEMDYSPNVEKALIDPDVLRWGKKVRTKIAASGMQEVLSTRYMIDMSDLKEAYDYGQEDWADIFCQGVSAEDRRRLGL